MKIHISFLGLIGTSALAIAATARADTLEQALAAAYENNPKVQGSRDLAAAADETVVQAKGAYGPSISVSASHEYTNSRLIGIDPTSRARGFGTTLGLSLSQPLFTSGRLAAGLDAATATQLIVRANLEETTQGLIFDVVEAYVTLQRDLELYGVAIENYDLLSQQREVTASRFRLRDATQPDLDQTDNRLQLATGRLINARATVEGSAARYRTLVGTYPLDLAPLPDLPAVPTLETLYVQAESSNPTLASIKFEEQRSRAVVAQARSAMRPQVTGFASLSREPYTAYQNYLRTESIAAGVNLSMQLYSGGVQSSAVREALDRNLSDQQRIEDVRRNMREALATDWSLLAAASDALPRYDAAVKAAEQAVAGVKTQERSGIRTLREVLDVTNDLLTARTAAVQTKADAYLRRVSLLRDAGLLSIGLFASVPPYDPESRKPALAGAAGLPLRPLIQPLDTLFVSGGVKRAPIQREDSDTYHWPAQVKDPLKPAVPSP